MCWKCSLPIDGTKEIFRSSTCPECGADLHSCRNCKFYEVGAHYDCHETIDELVTDKERSNFCDYFSAKAGLANNNIKNNDKSAKDAFNSLFSL